MARKALSYGEIADTVLPSAVFTVDNLSVLAKDIDTYVQLPPHDRPAFMRDKMDSIWSEAIDWSCRPQTPEFKNQWSALKRYYKEQGRIRGPPALPEKLSTRKWTGLRVCGIVYRDSIDEMVYLGTGMRPGDTRGYIGHRIKCRTVFYWKLPPQERLQLTDMAKEWQAGAAPAEQKMEAYYRRFQTWIRNVHLTALREFGQHLVTMAIPEPGLTNPPRLHEFMHELRILDKPLVKTVPVGDTLSDIYREVNHAAGRIEGAALPTLLNKKSRLKRKTTWTIDETSFFGHDELVLSEDEFDEELFFKEAISMVYTIVRMAHSNISSYRDLDPPWASFHQLVDSKYLLPDTPMSIPTALRQPNCFKYLKHWFKVTKGLKFNQWQRKNSLPMDPVPQADRWWASSIPSYLRSTETIPAAAVAALDFVPTIVHSPRTEGSPMALSPYGSQGGHIVHGDSDREQDALEMLDIPSIPDPDDLLPVTASAEHARTELVWTFVLGWISYLRGYSAAGGLSTGDDGVAAFTIGCATFTAVFEEFSQDLSQYADKYQYPGWAPSSRYALANSRTHYLAYLVRNEEHDVLLPLLRLVTRMEPGNLESPFFVVPHTSSRDAPSWITEHHGVPSWQWQRCGLPPSSHTLPHLSQIILEWLKRPDLLVDMHAGKPRSRETGLAVILKIALIFADLENLDDENWTYSGAASLQHSTLRPHVGQLKSAIAEWANDTAVRLEGLLPVLDDLELLGEAELDAECPGSDAFNGANGASASDDSRSMRKPASDFRPSNMDAAFLAVEMDDIHLPHTVQEYRQAMDDEPRTAVQELTRKSLQGLAALEDRKHANRLLRAGISEPNLGSRAKKAARAPAPKITAGAWQPMPAETLSSPQSDEEDAPPPKKRRRTMVIRKPRLAGQDQTPRTAGRKPKQAQRQTVPPARGARKKGAARNARGGGRKRKIKTPEPASESSSQSDVDGSHRQSDSRGVSDAGSDSDEMPAYISIQRRSRYSNLIRPVTFDAEGTTTSGLDSDAIGSALSAHPPPPRRLAFVEPREPMVLATPRVSTRRSQRVRPPSTAAQQGDISVVGDTAVPFINVTPADGLRRSSRRLERSHVAGR
ncbi:unnamed protein product [Peniophora sp. CBMAI 1063]|nr:unnamed protein product [Peniophora sp. CBMAI 1063]